VTLYGLAVLNEKESNRKKDMCGVRGEEEKNVMK
jgi:hypothetical protein